MYIGIFLDTDSITLLLENAPTGQRNRYADHVTLAFWPGMDMEGHFAGRLGELVGMEVTGLISTSRLDAVRIKLPTDLERGYSSGVPHVTIATADGVLPGESSRAVCDAAAAGEMEPFSGWIHGRIGFIMHSGEYCFSLAEYNRVAGG